MDDLEEDRGDEHNKVEQVPLVEINADIENYPAADKNEVPAVAVKLGEQGNIGALGGLPINQNRKNKRKPIRMLNEDGTIYEMEDNIVLPEGWGSESDED